MLSARMTYINISVSIKLNYYHSMNISPKHDALDYNLFSKRIK